MLVRNKGYSDGNSWREDDVIDAFVLSLIKNDGNGFILDQRNGYRYESAIKNADDVERITQLILSSICEDNPMASVLLGGENSNRLDENCLYEYVSYICRKSVDSRLCTILRGDSGAIIGVVASVDFSENLSTNLSRNTFDRISPILRFNENLKRQIPSVIFKRNIKEREGRFVSKVIASQAFVAFNKFLDISEDIESILLKLNNVQSSFFHYDIVVSESTNRNSLYSFRKNGYEVLASISYEKYVDQATSGKLFSGIRSDSPLLYVRDSESGIGFERGASPRRFSFDSNQIILSPRMRRRSSSNISINSESSSPRSVPGSLGNEDMQYNDRTRANLISREGEVGFSSNTTPKARGRTLSQSSLFSEMGTNENISRSDKCCLVGKRLDNVYAHMMNNMSMSEFFSSEAKRLPFAAYIQSLSSVEAARINMSKLEFVSETGENDFSNIELQLHDAIKQASESLSEVQKLRSTGRKLLQDSGSQYSEYDIHEDVEMHQSEDIYSLKGVERQRMGYPVQGEVRGYFNDSGFVKDITAERIFPPNMPESIRETYINNCGDIYSTSNSVHHSVKEIEREIIHMFAQLYNEDELSGYVTSGGSEANTAALWWGRRFIKNKTSLALVDKVIRQRELEDSIRNIISKNDPILVLNENIELDSLKENYETLDRVKQEIDDVTKPFLFVSEAAHYSLFKAAEQLEIKYVKIPCNKAGSIELSLLQKALALYKKGIDLPVKEDFALDKELFSKCQLHEGSDRLSRHVVVVATLGTTMNGAIDDIETIYQMLEEMYTSDLGEKRYVLHADAALLGSTLPITNAKYAYLFNWADSMSISGHKFLGTNGISGVVLAKQSYIQSAFGNDTRQIGYVGNICDNTLLGSRSGINVIELHRAMCTLDMHRETSDPSYVRNLSKLVNTCLKNARDLYERLIALESIDPKEVIYNESQFSVIFPKPKDQAMVQFLHDTYSLMPVGDKFSITVLANVDKSLIEHFIENYSSAMFKEMMKDTDIHSCKKQMVDTFSRKVSESFDDSHSWGGFFARNEESTIINESVNGKFLLRENKY